jgi:branched-chain amino acid transport system ATP-binding protein
MLEVAGLSVRYGKHLALADATFCVRRGEIVVLLGANGAGKSSCLRALGGLVTPAPGAHSARWRGARAAAVARHC